MSLCECGCGREVKSGNRFIHGHNQKGIPRSEETKTKIGDGLRGKKLPEPHQDQRGEKNHMFGKNH